MLPSQVIKVSVDSVIGNEPVDLPKFMIPWLEKIGGIPFLKENLWVAAVLIAALALGSAVFRYLNTLFRIV